MISKKVITVLAVAILAPLAVSNLILGKLRSTIKISIPETQLEITPTTSIQKGEIAEPMSSSNYILLERDTNNILLEKNSSQIIYPASTTKLATAVTALNIFNLNQAIEISNLKSEGKRMGLKNGEKILVSSLVKGLLVHSANDAAVSLANAYPGGYTKFVDSMNLLAKQYSMKNTNFTNVDGTDGPAHYSTAYDLAQLGRVASQQETILNIALIQSETVTNLEGTISHPLETTNELLGKEAEIVGLKTGWTPQAGESFVGLIKYQDTYFISVVANSTDRFGDTKKILNWLRQQKVK